MDSEVDSAAIICGCEGDPTHAHAIKKVWSGDGRTLDRLLRSQFTLESRAFSATFIVTSTIILSMPSQLPVISAS